MSRKFIVELAALIILTLVAGWGLLVAFPSTFDTFGRAWVAAATAVLVLRIAR